MVLIAGAAYGLWLFQDEFSGSSVADNCLFAAVAVLGGISLAGVPIVIIDRIRTGRNWRSGALLWFAVGMTAWSLAPAVTFVRLKVSSDHSIAGPCFVYALPLMGLFSLATIFIGGRPVRRWWTCRGWWPEWFGMWMLVGWAGVGSYVLFLIYQDLFK